MKNDFVVRRRFSSEQRADLIAQYHRSGLTQAAFAQKHQFSLATLTKWLETTQIYLHASLELKEKALAKTESFYGRPPRYRPPDQLMAFLQSL